MQKRQMLFFCWMTVLVLLFGVLLGMLLQRVKREDPRPA
jgi:uncharacterized membrane protein AbrB (regulator of aidB expression)